MILSFCIFSLFIFFVMITDNLLHNLLCPFVYFIIDFVLRYLWMLSSLFYFRSGYFGTDNPAGLGHRSYRHSVVIPPQGLCSHFEEKYQELKHGWLQQNITWIKSIKVYLSMLLNLDKEFFRMGFRDKIRLFRLKHHYLVCFRVHSLLLHA